MLKSTCYICLPIKGQDGRGLSLQVLQTRTLSNLNPSTPTQALEQRLRFTASSLLSSHPSFLLPFFAIFAQQQAHSPRMSIAQPQLYVLN